MPESVGHAVLSLRCTGLASLNSSVISDGGSGGAKYPGPAEYKI